MANYNSVTELFNAGTANMSVIRSSKNDDACDSITGVNWFTFNGVTANTVYISGNSWFGFGSNSEQLKVNRNDCAVFYIYKEEGTVHSTKFLKLRWQGYSYYNNTSSSYGLTYDVVLWETGDISLHMLRIPTNGVGTYSLISGSNTYSYSVSTSSPDVTFKKTDSGFEISKDIIVLPTSKYLIKSGLTYYIIQNNTLTELQAEELTAEIFSKYGADKLPSAEVLLALDSPEILWWHELETYRPSLTIYINPILPQIVYSELMAIPEMSTIYNIDADASVDGLLAVTFDEGQTWKYFNNGTWINSILDTEGMSVDTLHEITHEQWLEVGNYTTVQFRCVLPTRDSYIDRIYFNLAPID